ncbi:MAG: YdcF family protein [Candidatus Aenigmatarchaeota archaeon]
MVKKNSIIILSNRLTPARELNDESKLRVDRGVRLFAQGVADYIIMNGGPGLFTETTSQGLYVPRDTHPVQCDMMRDYALGLGILSDNILIQNYSSDSIGEAYFVKEIVLARRKLMDNIVVTSNYHVNRVREIYRQILGPDYLTGFEGVETELDNDPDILTGEKHSLDMFLRLFGELQSGDSKRIEQILYDSHALYSKIPEAERLRFY